MTDFAIALWRKSIRSQQGGSCVECAFLGGAAAVRDSKRPEGGHLEATRPEWVAFLGAVKAGHFDL